MAKIDEHQMLSIYNLGKMGQNFSWYARPKEFRRICTLKLYRRRTPIGIHVHACMYYSHSDVSIELENGAGRDA